MNESPSLLLPLADRVRGRVLPQLVVSVLGLGAVGRQVALQLAAYGARHLQLIDFDRVEAANLAAEGYLPQDVGLFKVAATARAVRELDVRIRIKTTQHRFRPLTTLGTALFCCVDSFACRAALWRIAHNRCRFWCDGRMLDEELRVLTVVDAAGRRRYFPSLFAQAEVRRGTTYAASITAGLMVHQFDRWLRRQPTDPDLTLDLTRSTLRAE